MANLLDLELTQKLTIDGRKVIQLKYGDLVIWDGTNIVLRLSDTTGLNESILGSSSLIFPDERAISAAIESFHSVDDSLADMIALDTTNIQVLLVSGEDELIRGRLLSLPALNLSDSSRKMNTSTAARANIEPLGARIADLDNMDVAVDAEHSGSIAPIITAIPKNSEAFINTLQECSSDKILVITVPSIDLKETVAVLAKSSAVRLRIEEATLPDVFTANTMDDSRALQIYSDDTEMSCVAGMTDEPGGVISIIYPTDVPISVTTALGTFVSNKTLLIYPDETTMKLDTTMNYREEIITQLYLTDWEYPVLVDNTLHITQVYSGNLSSNVLKIE